MSKPEVNDALPKIGQPAVRALESVGITRLSQVATMSKAELLNLHGMGPKAFGILEAALTEKGLAFAEPK